VEELRRGNLDLQKGGEGNNDMLEIPPVDSPQTAVKMSICSDIKQGKTVPSTK
jgi:hypothetical protein